MKYVWIVTQANETGTEATVVRQLERAAQAQQVSSHMDHGGYEGPVPASMYPVGKVFSLE